MRGHCNSLKLYNHVQLNLHITENDLHGQVGLKQCYFFISQIVYMCNFTSLQTRLFTHIIMFSFQFTYSILFIFILRCLHM